MEPEDTTSERYLVMPGREVGLSSDFVCEIASLMIEAISSNLAKLIIEELGRVVGVSLNERSLATHRSKGGIPREEMFSKADIHSESEAKSLDSFVQISIERGGRVPRCPFVDGASFREDIALYIECAALKLFKVRQAWAMSRIWMMTEDTSDP